MSGPLASANLIRDVRANVVNINGNGGVRTMLVIAVAMAVFGVMVYLLSSPGGFSQTPAKSASGRDPAQPSSSLDYEDGLTDLWGGRALALLREAVRKGDISDSQVRTMAARMDVLIVYERNIRLDLTENFERMLEAWYDQRLFELSSGEARTILVEILENSNIVKKIVSKVAAAMD